MSNGNLSGQIILNIWNPDFYLLGFEWWLGCWKLGLVVGSIFIFSNPLMHTNKFGLNFFQNNFIQISGLERRSSSHVGVGIGLGRTRQSRLSFGKLFYSNRVQVQAGRVEIVWWVFSNSWNASLSICIKTWSSASGGRLATFSRIDHALLCLLQLHQV